MFYTRNANLSNVFAVNLKRSELSEEKPTVRHKDKLFVKGELGVGNGTPPRDNVSAVNVN